MSEQRFGGLRHAFIVRIKAGEQGTAETDGHSAFLRNDAAVGGHAVVFHAGNEMQRLDGDVRIALIAHSFQCLEHGVGFRAGTCESETHGLGSERPAHGQAEACFRGGLHGPQSRSSADVAAAVGYQKNTTLHALSAENVSSVKSWKPFLRRRAAKRPSPSISVCVKVPS